MKFKDLQRLAENREWSVFKAELKVSATEVKSQRRLNELLIRSTLAPKLDIFDALLEMGADINGRWKTYTALTVACETIDPARVRALVTRGADIDQPGFDRASPLVRATKNGTEWQDDEIRKHSLRTAKFLINQGCNVDQKDNVGNTALDYAFEAHWPAAAKELLKAGASIDRCSDNGRSLLFHACTHPTAELLSLYLRFGGDPTLRVGNKSSASDFLTRSGKLEMKALLEKHLPAN